MVGRNERADLRANAETNASASFCVGVRPLLCIVLLLYPPIGQAGAGGQAGRRAGGPCAAPRMDGWMKGRREARAGACAWVDPFVRGNKTQRDQMKE